MQLFAVYANSVKNDLVACDVVTAGQQCLPIHLRVVGHLYVIYPPQWSQQKWGWGAVFASYRST